MEDENSSGVELVQLVSRTQRNPVRRPSFVLGLSCYFHDSAAALLKDGEIIAAAEEERFTRIKHDNQFPLQAIRYVLLEAGISLHDVSRIIFYEKPFLKFDRILETFLARAPQDFLFFSHAFSPWISKNLFFKRNLARNLKKLDSSFVLGKKQLLFGQHHRSHAASAFFASPFSEAAVVCADGVGEWSTTTVWKGRGNELKSLKSIDFPNSLGLFYSAFTAFCGFRVLSGEYKLMGLAAYGEDKYKDQILENFIRVFEDGSFELNQKFFNFYSTRNMYSPKFSEVFGCPPRTPETDFSQVYADIAASAQSVLEDVLLKIARYAHELTGSENLCLAGGVALNCRANQKIIANTPFKRIWIQPAAGDSGGALGAALDYWFSKEKRSSPVSLMRDSCWGPRFSDSDIGGVLDAVGIPYQVFDNGGAVDRAADLLSQSKVIGWFQGRMEFGPRALGNRSILADPRDASMKHHLNRKIKFREQFRPFAPAILEDHFAEYFEGEPNPFMLITADGRKPSDELKGTYPFAAIHEDGTARVQTVTSSHSRFYDLLKSFKNKTGCPSLLNTSFNLRGEPIVCTPEDALRTFVHSEMDSLFLGNVLIERSDVQDQHIQKLGNISTESD